MKHFFSSVIFLLVVSIGFAQVKIFNVLAYGVKGDGKKMNSIAIQKAIDAAAKTSGTVLFPKGNFITGPIELKSGVELRLLKGAQLLGSTERSDYGSGDAKPLIGATNATQIAITGSGTIDGRGQMLMKNFIRDLQAGKMQLEGWPAKRPREASRPQIIGFVGCSNITVKGITIKNSATWVQHYERCNSIMLDSLTVESVAYWNNDGIDINNSKNVSVTNCNINSADDGICLKSEGSILDSCINVYVANCRIRSSANAFKIGTGSKGGFRNIRVDGLAVYDTYRSAVALEAVDGGFLENVEVKNVRATNTGCAVFIRLGHRNKTDAYSTLKNVYVSNMYVEVPAGKPDAGYPIEGPTLKYPPGFKPTKGVYQSVSPWSNSSPDSTAIPYEHNVFPSSISGLPGHPVQNVTLENIEIVYAGGADRNRAYFPVDSLEKITEAEAAYPEFSMFGELPVWGLYVRHAEGIALKNIKICTKGADHRTAVIMDDVASLKIDKLSVPKAVLPALILNKVTNLTLNSLQLPGVESEAIRKQ
jgi:polygalacturonase